ncbi:DUF4214 domain-containing protein [Mameliella sp.]|uniref:DUF4214 domain-containing protein n=1 Tax=Mameliella sp. TaxID=1924940 RepID=UPI003BABA5F9
MTFRLHQSTLARASDGNDHGYCTQQLADGATYFDAVGGFVHSPEFQATYSNLTDEAFVEMLYQNVLNRASDAGGKAVWVPGTPPCPGAICPIPSSLRLPQSAPM